MENKLSDYQKAQKWLEGYDWDNDPTADDNLATICYALQEIEKYEDLKEQGKLLRPPCKIGETVFVIDYDTTKCPHCLGLDGCYECSKSNPKDIKRKRFTFGMMSRFNKDIFLTQEQAESALKEMEGENER